MVFWCTGVVYCRYFCMHDSVHKLRAVEAEKAVLLARAEAAERVLVKGESKDQARIEELTGETRASRLKFLALSERLRQLTRLRDEVRTANCYVVDVCKGLCDVKSF